jgi:ferrous iron transport protein B
MSDVVKKLQLKHKKILLVGNPNVGKSVIFSKLTGVHVTSANYPGTTIEYTQGFSRIGFNEVTIIDSPGVYSLEAKSEAEKITLELLNQNIDIILCVLDATNLERNLNLGLQLREFNIPIIYALNLVDISKRYGIQIDIEKLSEHLKAPVIPTIATRNTGIREIIIQLSKAKNNYVPFNQKLDYKHRWTIIEEIIEDVTTHQPYTSTFIDKLEDWTVKTWPGLPIAAFVLLLSVGIVVGFGKGLRAFILLPLIRDIYSPWITQLITSVFSEGFISNVLIGEFGILIIGIEWPFALILPYVGLFYLVFTFLEDCGYLPRIAVLVDGLLKKVGISGGNIIPIMMGFGCAVPAILGTRASSTHKERLIVTTLIAFAIPCASQSGAFFALLADQSMFALIFMFFLSFFVLILVGLVMDKLIHGRSQPMLLEIPNLLIPDARSYLKKFSMKMKHFFLDAEGAMLLGILIASLIAETGILNSVSILIQPLTEGWLGLPKEASLSLILGIIRRELAVLPLLELNLTTLQLIVGSTVALFYLPCIAVFGVVAKEFSVKFALLIAFLTTTSAFVFAGMINHIGNYLINLL